MDRSQNKDVFPDDQTLEAWSSMRKEVWHELQEGASADVPEELIDLIGTLVVILDAWRAEIRRSPGLPARA
jgi:hypothetical protein